MKEIVIISGKGGTGKTSLTAAFSTLASRSGKAVFADCDVDAADLHLVLAPQIREKNEFISGRVARINPEKCTSRDRDNNCAKCAELCRFGAISVTREKGCVIDEGSCEGCGICVRFCPTAGIDFADRRCGEWYVSDTRFGTLVHAALDVRAENSGKLVTTVRKEAKRIAEAQQADYILVDGSPGIGCPVIASITGASAVVIVTEPTLSGQHDLVRVAGLCRHFDLPFSVIVNKADINATIAEETKAWCERNVVPFLGMIPYDGAMTKAQIKGRSVIEYDDSGDHKITAIIAEIWEKICQITRSIV